jgi:hypothetical protein
LLRYNPLYTLATMPRDPPVALSVRYGPYMDYYLELNLTHELAPASPSGAIGGAVAAAGVRPPGRQAQDACRSCYCKLISRLDGQKETHDPLVTGIPSEKAQRH